MYRVNWNATGGSDRLADLWARFISGDEVDLTPLRSEIADSWRRCRAMGIEPDRTRVPRAEASPSSLDDDLVQAGAPVVSFLNDALLGGTTLINLTNEQAKILMVMGGHTALDVANRINALPESRWDEAAAGTNVVGTGVICRKPLQVMWREHYIEEWQKWACCSAPIWHPFQEQLIGTLVISGFREPAHPRMLELAVHASGLITDSIRKLESERRLVVANTFADFLRRYPDAAVVALDGCGYVTRVSARVGALLGNRQLRPGHRLCDLGQLSPDAQRIISCRGDRPREVELDLPSGTSRVIVHPVTRESQVVGSVAVVLPVGSSSAAATKNGWAVDFSFSDIVGRSVALRETVEAAVRAAGTPHPILLVGESGTGKELFAHAIHGASPRHAGPFVAFNCGTLSSELAIAEMCGYEPGSFTGADRRTRSGVLDLANDGTLFLDELQDLEAKVQALLLRFLETGIFLRVGGNRPVRSDLRVVAATNIPLTELESRRLVRPDLLYRLSCIVIEVPPLRERPEDIRPLGEKCLQDLSFSGSVAEPVWSALERAEWRGNVRELRNVLLRATLACSDGILTPSHLPRQLLGETIRSAPVAAEPDDGERLRAALAETGGNVRAAARRLGIHWTTLYRRLRRLGIRR